MNEDTFIIVSVSMLNQYSFCLRRCALMHVEGIWSDNEHTAKGTILHKHADELGYEVIGKAKLLRALPLYSNKYGLSGKADIVEIRGGEVIPVEYKKGKRREFDNDNIQLTAQALCLEEMFQTTISRGFIYHASSKKRREVLIGETLRKETIEIIETVRNLLINETIPSAEYKSRCEGCSLFNICLPKLSDTNERNKLTTDFGL
jgi:CRISPR-associated exonuclease Cas4